MTTATRKLASEVGGCNFCNRPTDYVTVVGGNGVNARLCDGCLKIVFSARPNRQRRAPRGYKIEQWKDGFYHVYSHAAGGECIGEFATITAAVQAAYDHKVGKK